MMQTTTTFLYLLLAIAAISSVVKADYMPEIELVSSLPMDAEKCSDDTVERLKARIVAEIAREAKNVGVIDEKSSEYSPWNADEWGDIIDGADAGDKKTRGLRSCPTFCTTHAHNANVVEHCERIPCPVGRRAMKKGKEPAAVGAAKHPSIRSRMLDTLLVGTAYISDDSCNRILGAASKELDVIVGELLSGDEDDGACLMHFTNLQMFCKFVQK